MDGVKRLLQSYWTIRVCQILTGVIFAWAGLAKIGDLPAFASQIHGYGLVPVFSENVLAMTLPWIEVIVALALLLGVRARAAAVVASALMVVFTVAVVIAFAQGKEISCGCFGGQEPKKIDALKLLENFGMTAGALIASLRPR
ncbi:MAG: DoxX family membrane protein [bacterium]|nr:DoxX family membrane protein [bacterium]